MSHAIAVVAHKARSEAAHALKEQVGAHYLAMDNGIYGVEANHHRCWEYLSTQDSTWSLVLEDDAVPIADFTNQLGKMLDAAPTDVVSLYLGTSRPVWWQPQDQPSARKLQPMLREAVAQAEVQGASFIVAPQLFHAVAVAMRTELIQPMLDFVTLSKRPIDYAISDWCENEGHKVSYPQPSLVDHEDGPSVAIHPDREPRLHPRKAYRLGGRGTWTTKTVELT